MHSKQSINSQFFFGIKISEQFFEIISEIDKFHFNDKNDIFFHVFEDSFIGVIPSSNEILDTNEHLLYEFSYSNLTECSKFLQETISDLKNQINSLVHKHILDFDDFYFLNEELSSIDILEAKFYLLSETKGV